GERWRRHATGEGTDVVLPERARPFAWMQIVRGRMQPSGLYDELVDLTELGQVDALAGGPILQLLNSLCVHPLSRLRVSLDLEIFRQLLVADRPTLAEEALDLFENQSVALDRRRVVRLLV